MKVLDFGIAKATQPLVVDEGAEVTRSNAILGSPQYMSPEQLRNPRNVDARTDIWAVGLTLYELLTGAPPFHGTTFGEIFAAILEQTPAPMWSKRPEIAPELDAIVARCLRRDPGDRFPNVAELATALSKHGTPRSAFSVQRIHSALPPPLAIEGAETVRREAVTAPPLSNTEPAAIASTALVPARSGRTASSVPPPPPVATSAAAPPEPPTAVTLAPASAEVPAARPNRDTTVPAAHPNLPTVAVDAGPPAAKGRTRVDQNGLAGENPFR